MFGACLMCLVWLLRPITCVWVTWYLLGACGFYLLVVYDFVDLVFGLGDCLLVVLICICCLLVCIAFGLRWGL